MIRSLSRVFFTLAVLASVAGSTQAADDFFETEIRPLLIEHCYECHGTGKIKGKLRLTSRAEALQGGESGIVIVPGKPKESLLIQALHYTGETKMPVRGKLPDAVIAKFSRWVEQGASWGKDAPAAAASSTAESGIRQTAAFLHPSSLFLQPSSRGWAFAPRQTASPPTVKNSEWVKSDLDRFILAELEAHGIAPAQPADKATLIRRATFDLTGLPPTPEELAAFLGDSSPEAFAKVVDRLLSSSAYGEKWGRHWLDVVRYADSRDRRGMGSAGDITEAWRYRDWVIQAFDRDYPYDRFIIDQIAGDRIPAPKAGEVNAAGLIATGLLTIGEWGTGDADKEKMVTDVVNDQIDVVSRGFLGLTIACARCHDHKFDPISQKDYYGLAGIFFSTTILPGPGAKTDGSPLLRTPLLTEAEVVRQNLYEKRIKTLETALAQRIEKESQAVRQTLSARTSDYLLAVWEYRRPAYWRWPWSVDTFAMDRDLDAAILKRRLDGLELPNYRRLDFFQRDLAGNRGLHLWRAKTDTPAAIINTTNAEVSHTTIKFPPRSFNLHPGPKSNVGVVWRSPITGKIAVRGKVIDADKVCGDGIAWRIDHRRQGELRELASGQYANGGMQKFDEGEKGSTLSEIAVKKGESIEWLVLPKGDYTCDSTTIEIEIVEIAGKRRWNLNGAVEGDLLGEASRNPHPDRYGNADVWEWVDAGASRPSSDPFAVAVRKELLPLTDRNAARRHADALARANPHLEVNSAYRLSETELESRFSIPAREAIAAIRRELAELRKNPPAPPAMALAAREGGVPGGMFPGFQDVPIHVRGSYTRLGKTVPRRFPEALAGRTQPAIRSGSGRLELAQWIASPDNPLTARVLVNRVWAWHFGEGIVRTPSNFGKMGEAPTHPELLDYLADQFVKDGWSIKRLHRRIMLSATYRLSSKTETSGQRAKALDPDNRYFGRFSPRRLEGEEVRDTLLFVAGKLDRTMGGVSFPDLQTPRRTVYFRTIRSDRNGYQPLFDGADPENPIEKRNVSTVAPQALFLLNHPFAVEQAKAFAGRIVATPGTEKERIDTAYRILFGREASEEEQAIGLKFLQASGATNRARWERYAQVLLCSNELVFVD